MRWPHVLRQAACAVWLAAACAAPAQSGFRLTSWRAADGLPQSSILGVTLDARGRALLTLDATLPVHRLDGFTVGAVSNTVGAPTRVHESRSEQFWAATSTGLLEQTGGGWNLHPLPEIAAEYRANPLRTIRPIPLLPLDRNRVLVLLPDRLLEYDSGERKTTLMVAAASTSLVRFHELGPARDDGVWVSGSRGLLRLPGPLRQLRPGAAFEEFLIPSTLQVGELQRPFQDRSGGVTTAAEDIANRSRVVVRFAAGRWNSHPVPGQNIRQAWAGPDGELWAHTAGTVLRLETDAGQLRPRTVLTVARVADVVLESSGAAWIATSDGLFHIAPLPWRSAPGFAAESGPVVSVTSDRRGRVVAATSKAVHCLDGGEWRTTDLVPVRTDDAPREREAIFALADGGLLVTASDRNRHVGAEGGLQPSPRNLETVVPLGHLPDGRILVLGDPAREGRLLAFDGTALTDFGNLPSDAERIGPPAVALQLRSGELWVGGTTGVAVRRGDAWTVFSNPDDGSSDGAFAALELPNGRLLVGGADTIREFDGRRWRILRRGFDRVHALQLGRDGTVWVAAASGLHALRDGVWLTFGEDEGLPSAAVLGVFEDGTGRLWAGTAQGLALFDPLADIDAPRAEIVGAEVPSRSGESRALFVVGGQDCWKLASPGRLVYSWQLDNSPWSPWRTASSVQFNELTAGTHRFSVRAMDPTGNRQSEPAALEFAVSLPWFRDPRLVVALIALAVLLVAMGIQGLHGYWRLKQSYAEVERQVAERSAQLERANAELLLSHKMRALGTLAAGVAHDFNNLLSIIKGSAQLLESQTGEPDRTRQRINRIKTAVDQGAGLVKAMLGYSRGATAPRKPVDPVDVVQRALRLLEEPIAARVEFRPPVPPPGPVPASPEMLQQIVLNLVQNADEATDHKGVVRVGLSTTVAVPDGCWLRPATSVAYVVLSVRDDGMGIPAGNLPRIFEPFFTTKGFSSRRGTGLGLSMVYEFAKELGAGLAVESTVGKGSTFSVLLPVTQSSGPA